MTSAQNAIRALLLYALVIPGALVVGYLVASRRDAGGYVDWQTWGPIILILGLLCFPLLLKWHHAILFFAWNTTAALLFLPGSPEVWFAMAFVSLGVAFLERALLREMKWISVPSVVFPVLFLVAVVLVTARLTTGIGVRALGSATVGGKAYFWIFAGAVGFIAMISRRVPVQKAPLYLGLFFLGALINVIPSTISFVPRWLYFIYFIFPVTGNDLGSLATSGIGETAVRFYGLTTACIAGFSYVLARFGIRGLFEKPWRFALLLSIGIAGSLGGFRSIIIHFSLLFLVLFMVEGHFRSPKYVACLFGAIVLVGAVVLPFADRMPLSIQRSLSIIPGVPLSPIARYEGEASTEWRIRVWQAALPDVSRYFWFGKGLGVGGGDLELTTELYKRGLLSSEDLSILTEAYHNGPLTVLIPFGIWGAIGWIWFLAASIRALYLNYRHGEESLKRINTFLLAFFISRTILYFVVFGDFRSDFAPFVGIIGLGLALNGGICRRAAVPVAVAPEPNRPESTFARAPAFAR